MSACSYDINVSSCGNPLTLLLRCYLLKKQSSKMQQNPKKSFYLFRVLHGEITASCNTLVCRFKKRSFFSAHIAV